MEIPRGEITKTVYTLIKDEKFVEAVEILEQLLELQPMSRSALSLLGHCNFQLQNFDMAASYYDRLVNFYPDIPEYHYHLAQSLYNGTNYEEALEASYLKGDPDPELQEKVVKLQAAIQYSQDEMAESKALVEKGNKADPDTEISKGCLSFKEGNFSDACSHFESAAKIVGMEPLLWYNRAVSCYKRGDLPSAAHYIGEVIEYGAMHFPELKMGHRSAEDGPKHQSVGNSRTLHKSALVETLNLKAALESELKKPKAARDTLRDLPPRSEHEVDPITLHNQAVLNVQLDPVEGLRKLRYLLEQNIFPPETFANLLILYWRFEHYDLMADLMAVYEEFKVKHLTHDMQRFFEALIKREVVPEEATKEMEDQCKHLASRLMEMVKKVANVRLYGNEDEVRNVCNEFDELVDRTYMPMLLTLGKIYWDKDELPKVEEILRQGAEFLDDRDPWLLNCAHVVYRCGKNYSEAAGLYELVVRKYQHELLQVSAASLANLVVCYVSIGRNEEAEKIINKIQEQEHGLLEKHKGVKVYHSCIMSLVIGTLYCVKNNYQFGIERIFQALVEINIKLGPDTWFYVKSCILSLVERIVKNSVTVTEDTLDETLSLLSQCEVFGRDVTTVIEETSASPQMEDDCIIPVNYGTKTIAYEARYLQYLVKSAKERSLI